MIDKKKIIKYIKKGGGVGFEDIRQHFNLQQKKPLKRLLSRLLENNRIMRIKRKYYAVSNIDNRDFDYIASKYKLRIRFTKKARKQAKDIVKTYNGLLSEERKKRKDLRSLFTITIDGEDAKDFDDAISIKKGLGGYTLWVHIADVSFFVNEDSPLDIEAKKRGCSVYLINKVVPMLPYELSNNICSLREGEDRLCVSVKMEFDKNGNIKSSEFYNSIIRVNKRLTYKRAQKILDEKVKGEEKTIKKHLKRMHSLAKLLYQKRIENGSIDFDFDEIEFEMGNSLTPINVYKKKRLDTHRIIEDFMLAANKSVATYLEKRTHSLFRVHDNPDKDNVIAFAKLLNNLGYRFKITEDIEPILYQNILFEIAGKEEESFIAQVMLRSMKQAEYSIQNIGHFGLAFDIYTHFTSPIRRYPDLIVHRLLKKLMNQKKSKKQNKKLEIISRKKLDDIAKHSSKMERIAMEAEREMIKIKSARFMYDKVGNVYNAVVSGVTPWGVYCEIIDYGIEGLIRYNDMKDDYYIYDEVNMCVRGKRRKKIYRLGSGIRIKVKRVNIEDFHIDFELA